MEFMEIINFLAIPADVQEACKNLGVVVILIHNVIDILKLIIPIGLILFGLIDLGKAVIAGKEDEMKKAQGTLMKRVIYAVAVFLIVVIVEFAIGLVGDTSWRTCWDKAATVDKIESDDLK